VTETERLLANVPLFQSLPESEIHQLAETLTVRDVTQPVRLSIVHYAPSVSSFTACATARIDRTEYGVTALRGLAGRYLDVTVEVQCVRK